MIANNALVQVSLRGRCFNQRIILTHFYRTNGAGPGASFTADLNLILDRLVPAGVDTFIPEYLALMPQSYTLETIRAQAITPVRSVIVERAIVGGAGTHPDPATTANDAATITFRTDLGGRRQTSTKHIGPTPDSAAAAGLVTGPYGVLLTNLAHVLDDTFVPVGWVGGLVPCVPHVDTGLYNDITSWVIGDTSRVMRRRTVRVGE